MKKIFLVTLFLFFVVLVLPNYAAAVRGIDVKPISPVGKRITGDNWLFIIGINTYLHWPRLETATNDARALKNVLLERYHYHQDYMIELYDEDATRRNIISKLRYLAKNLTENDSLLIFYAGHGHLDSITREGSWVPVESGVKDASSWISNHDIKNYLKIDAVKAKHILLVSDSCFSGDFFRGHRGRLLEVTDKVIKKAWGLPSRQAITSGGLEPVTDAGFGGNSVFSHFMVAALKENTNPFLIPSDLFPAIKAGVAENAEQFPCFGTLKDTGGSQGGEYIFFLRQDTRLNDVSAKAQKRQAELDRLKQLDAEMQAARKLEESEIKKREKELSILDSQIDEMRKKLGTPSAGAGDSLDNMLVMVERKEEQQKRFEVLKRKREQEERHRKAELARLKKEKRKKIEPQLDDDIRKYNKIISSSYGKQMKEAAWKSLVANYPDASEIDTGDVGGLKALVLDGLKSRFWTDSVTGMEFVWVPEGCYQMGCGSWSDRCNSIEKPVHEVCVDGFWMGRYEVTQGQWKRIMGDNPSHFKKGDNYPVEEVSWDDAKKFIKKLNARSNGSYEFRLPTEAEWEYACRSGGKPEKYCGGNDVDSLAWYSGNSGKSTHPIGTKNPNGLGIYDMSGNIYEWCEDTYSDNAYSKHSRNNPIYTGGSTPVLRGGSWDYSPRRVRSANRCGDSPGDRNSDRGFRLLRRAGGPE